MVNMLDEYELVTLRTSEESHNSDYKIDNHRGYLKYVIVMNNSSFQIWKEFFFT